MNPPPDDALDKIIRRAMNLSDDDLEMENVPMELSPEEKEFFIDRHWMTWDGELTKLGQNELHAIIARYAEKLAKDREKK